MKKLFLSLLVVACAGSAFATETAYVLQPLINGRGNVEPCPSAPESPVPANGYCYPGRECPYGYESIAKYCFRGGFHRCGIACIPDHTYRN